MHNKAKKVTILRLDFMISKLNKNYRVLALFVYALFIFFAFIVQSILNFPFNQFSITLVFRNAFLIFRTNQ